MICISYRIASCQTHRSIEDLSISILVFSESLSILSKVITLSISNCKRFSHFSSFASGEDFFGSRSLWMISARVSDDRASFCFTFFQMSILIVVFLRKNETLIVLIMFIGKREIILIARKRRELVVENGFD